MKKSELKQIIKEEVQNILNEEKIKMEVYALYISEDGRFSGVNPDIYFNTSSEEEAKILANKYTNGEFTKYPGFYNLKKLVLPFYK